MDHDGRIPIGATQSSRERLEAPLSVEHSRREESLVGAVDLHESIRDVLRLTARATLRDGMYVEPNSSCRQAMNRVCELARRDELRIEQLLVLMKDAWRRMPEVQSVSRLDADLALASVITYCIQEFYRPRRLS